MKTLVTAGVVLLLCAGLCSGVNVQIGRLSYTLDEVKELDYPLNASPKFRPFLCAKLPDKFKQACLLPNAGEALATLEQVAHHPDKCEICAYTACYGC